MSAERLARKEFSRCEKARDHVIVKNRHQPAKLHLRTYIEDRYKITLYRDRNFGELFDLQNDPNECYNRWDDAEYSSVKCGLLQRFN